MSSLVDRHFAVLHEVVQRHGAPLALYSDRHGIFTKSDPEDPKPTQFERALLQLHIEPICAHTPQAKGRVERLFQTLQDRLCKALRLQGIAGIEQANEWLGTYLQQHNRRFAVAPREAADLHQPWRGARFARCTTSVNSAPRVLAASRARCCKSSPLSRTRQQRARWSTSCSMLTANSA